MRRTALRAVVLALAFGSSIPAGSAQTPTNTDHSGHTNLRPGAFPIRTNVTNVPAAQASLRDDDIVIGVSIGSESRAYPVNLMWEPPNEVLNDRLGGTDVAVTWCPIAHAASVYGRKLDGRDLVLGSVGLENGVSVLFDQPTGSWWSQVVGRGRRGPLQGQVLVKRPSLLTTWGEWRALHPDTTAFVDPALPGRRRFTQETFSRITLAGPGRVVNEDLTVGVEGPRRSRAYLVRALAGVRVVNDVLDGDAIAVFLADDDVSVRVLRRALKDRVLRFERVGREVRDAETGSTWDLLRGTAVAGPLSGTRLDALVHTYALWYAWRSERPDSGLWAGPEGAVTKAP